MKCNMKCEYTSIILALLITLFVCMILYHLVYSTMEGMDALDSAQNYLANNISVSSNLADRISTLKDQQPPSPTLSSPMAVVTMDAYFKDDKGLVYDFLGNPVTK